MQPCASCTHIYQTYTCTYVRNGRSWLNKGCMDNIVCAALHSSSTFVTASRYIFVGITTFAISFIPFRPLSLILLYRTFRIFYLPPYLFPLPLYFSIFFFFFFIFLVGVDHPPTSDFTLGEKAFAEQPFCINEMFAFPFCTLAITFKKNIYRSLFNSNTHVFHFPVFRCLHMVLIVIINDGKCFVS